jgi:hypothetical protein
MNLKGFYAMGAYSKFDFDLKIHILTIYVWKQNVEKSNEREPRRR